MKLGILTVDLYLNQAGTLKEKRMILKSLKDKLRGKFNISITELDHHNKWQRTVLGIAAICNEHAFLNRQLSLILEYINKVRSLEVLDHQIELL